LKINAGERKKENEDINYNQCAIYS